MNSPSTGGTAVLAVSLGSGGAEKQVVLLANHLASGGGRPMVVTLVDDTHRLPDLDSSVDYVCLGMEPGSNGPRRLGHAFTMARKALVGRSPSRMVSFTDPANRLGWALRASGIHASHVLSERNSNLGSAARVQSRRLLYRNADVIVANTSATRLECLRRGLVKEDRICVIPNAVDVPTVLERPVRQDGPFRWLCVARLEPQKDIPSLLSAAAKLRASGHEFTVDIVGRGHLEGELVHQTDSLGLEAQVRFLGERRDIPALLNAADGFVLPSAWEGLPNAVLEAAAAGLTVVATDVGGTREALPCESQGLLVPSRSPEALAERMASVMEMGGAERMSISEANFAHVRGIFSPEAVFRLWDEILLSDQGCS